MWMNTTRITFACVALLASGCSKAVDPAESYEAVCTATSAAENVPAVACKVIPDAIEQFVTDSNEKRGAYVIATVQNFYQANTAGWGAAWRTFVDDFGVDEAHFDPKSHAIVRGHLNDVIEAMYKGADIDYGGDRRAFRRGIEKKMSSPEARAFLDKWVKHYMQQMTD